MYRGHRWKRSKRSGLFGTDTRLGRSYEQVSLACASVARYTDHEISLSQLDFRRRSELHSSIRRRPASLDNVHFRPRTGPSTSIAGYHGGKTEALYRERRSGTECRSQVEE